MLALAAGAFLVVALVVLVVALVEAFFAAGAFLVVALVVFLVAAPSSFFVVLVVFLVVAFAAAGLAAFAGSGLASFTGPEAPTEYMLAMEAATRCLI